MRRFQMSQNSCPVSIFDVELHLTHSTHCLLTKETQNYIELHVYIEQTRACPALNLRPHLPNIREDTNAQDFCKTKKRFKYSFCFKMDISVDGADLSKTDKKFSISSASKWTLALLVQAAGLTGSWWLSHSAIPTTGFNLNTLFLNFVLPCFTSFTLLHYS